MKRNTKGQPALECTVEPLLTLRMGQAEGALNADNSPTVTDLTGDDEK